MKEKTREVKETQFELKIQLIINNHEKKEDIQMIQMIKYLKKTLGKKEVLLILNMKINNLIKVVKVVKVKNLKKK